MSLYPLVFKPRLVEKMWGGRKLETTLGKELPAGKSIGESWELFDFPPGVVDSSGEWVSSVVSNGPLKGRTLHTLVEEYRDVLMGDVALVGRGQFPILIKFLDAREDLSVQVHPDENYAAKNAGAHLKSEAWYVMQHDPNARLLKGLTPGSDREKFADAVKTGDVEKHIQSIPVSVGDCHYLPSGTIHALGAGILVAEVQTPSDTTFRVHDFNRVDPTTGKVRTLHVDQALECIDFDADEKASTQVQGAVESAGNQNRLVTSPYFKIDRWSSKSGEQRSITTGEPTVWIMLEGTAELKTEGLSETTLLKTGETALLPAVMNPSTMKSTADCTWLQVTFPKV